MDSEKTAKQIIRFKVWTILEAVFRLWAISNQVWNFSLKEKMQCSFGESDKETEYRRIGINFEIQNYGVYNNSRNNCFT